MGGRFQQHMPGVGQREEMRQRSALERTVGLAMASILCVSVSGCSGCRPDSTKPDDKPKEEQLEDFESGELKLLPMDSAQAAYGAKPGHWISVRQQMKSNRMDFEGLLEGTVTDASRTPFTLAASSVRLRSRRPVSLPKGQAKSMELTYFVPESAHRRRRVALYSDLLTGYGGGLRHTQPQITNRLRPHQTYFVVLARNPDAYTYVKTLESIDPPTDEMLTGEVPGDYLVVLPATDKVIPLPAWPLMWSSTSFLLWDDVDPTALSSDQQRALVDWLHWGGQVIISGPNSLESLRASFLGDYLPADAGPIEEVSEARVMELSGKWSAPSTNSNIDTSLTLVPGSKFEALRLSPREGSQFVSGTAELVAERRVGRGRVAVTAFALTRREITNWRGFDNFFNATLMRRPSRKFTKTTLEDTVTSWSDPVQKILDRELRRRAVRGDYLGTSPEDELATNSQRLPDEAMITSRLRYFTRDAAPSKSTDADEPDEVRSFDIVGYSSDARTGIAGWNDSSRCSQLAERSLTSAAGISVPDRTLILWSLGLYLFVLVPANWTIFRALDRVEWAWFTVPLIAIVGTVAVVRLAQLDIGFARSRTEFAVIETQADHLRAHVTRYIGLYTSLTTDYQLNFVDDSAVAIPFAPREASSLPSLGSSTEVAMVRTSQRDARVQLQGLVVNSNSTEMVHCESMLDLGGPLQLLERPSGLTELNNQTAHDLVNVAVVRRRHGELQFAGLRLLRAGATMRIEFRNVEPDQLVAEWQQMDGAVARGADEFEINGFQQLAANPERIHEGDVKMFAWSDTMLPGLNIDPPASQQTFLNLWIVNLRYGQLPAPRSDSNTPDYRPEAPEDTDDRID